MVTPVPGTPAHDEFVRRARDPNSMEGKIVQQMVRDASDKTQQQVRAMLNEMIRLVPGQLFRDIGLFHEKFALPQTSDPGHRLPVELLEFRLKFMQEELDEYMDAVGISKTYCGEHGQYELEFRGKFDAEQAFDALIDLCYVALGTAYLHRFPFNEGWALVQEANMKKVRTERADDSKRGSTYDVVKPKGWAPAPLINLLDEVCSNCQGRGFSVGGLEYEDSICPDCGGTGRRRHGSTEEAPAK